MRSRTLTLPTLILAALGALATPAFAAIQFSYCYLGCGSINSNAGMTYTAFQAVTSGLTFPVSPITFDSANLSGGGIYTDPATGAIFTGFGGTTQEALIVSGTALAETGTNGTDRPIQIDLPANTYAIAVFLATVSGTAYPKADFTATVAAFNSGAFDYELGVTTTSGGVFFGLVSNTPLAKLLLGSTSGTNGPLMIQSFEIGQVAETPEASTFALIGGGLLLVRFLRKPALGKLAP